MYDYLRPRIIHETKIETLSELCLILINHINRDVINKNNIDGLFQIQESNDYLFTLFLLNFFFFHILKRKKDKVCNSAT